MGEPKLEEPKEDRSDLEGNLRDKNRRIKDTVNPETGERVILLTKKQLMENIKKELKEF